MTYTKEQLAYCTGARVPDLIGPGVKLVFVGINPGLQTAMTGIHFAHQSNRFWPALKKAGIIDFEPDITPLAPSVPWYHQEIVHRNSPWPWTAATQTHFSYPGNRFYPALHRAGITPYPIDPGAGMSDDDREMMRSIGVGITNFVARATARADELTKEELMEGGRRLEEFVERWTPEVVAIAGLGAYRTAFRRPKAKKGCQEETIAGATIWLMGNPSGLNAHETVETLAEQFRAAALAAGVL